MVNEGLIRFVVLLLIAVVVLGFFGISIKAVFQKQTVQENLSFVWQTTQYVWHTYLAVPAQYAWNIFYNLLWRSFVENAERLKRGELPNFIEGQPKLQEPAQ